MEEPTLKKRPIILTAFVLLVIAGGLALGRGGDANADRYDGESKGVAHVLDQLAEASRAGDGARICNELFTKSLRISVARASGGSCAEQVGESIGAEDASFVVRKLRTEGDSAEAVVVDSDSRSSAVYLQRTKGQWRIAAVGAA
jgi:hypothetical protein